MADKYYAVLDIETGMELKSEGLPGQLGIRYFSKDGDKPYKTRDIVNIFQIARNSLYFYSKREMFERKRVPSFTLTSDPLIKPEDKNFILVEATQSGSEISYRQVHFPKAVLLETVSARRLSATPKLLTDRMFDGQGKALREGSVAPEIFIVEHKDAPLVVGELWMSMASFVGKHNMGVIKAVSEVPEDWPVTSDVYKGAPYDGLAMIWVEMADLDKTVVYSDLDVNAMKQAAESRACKQCGLT